MDTFPPSSDSRGPVKAAPVSTQATTVPSKGDRVRIQNTPYFGTVFSADPASRTS